VKALTGNQKNGADNARAIGETVFRFVIHFVVVNKKSRAAGFKITRNRY
jgi:hypothetical protein